MSHHQTQTPVNAAITIRRMDLNDDDGASLARLAELDSNEPLDGAVLGIEVEGRLLAATSLTTGQTIADPFSRTGELTVLLKARAAQIRRRDRKRAPRRRGRAAVAGGPAGQISTLPRWG